MSPVTSLAAKKAAEGKSADEEADAGPVTTMAALRETPQYKEAHKILRVHQTACWGFVE